MDDHDHHVNQPVTNGKCGGDDNVKKKYRVLLLKKAEQLAMVANGAPASNKGAIPMLATAGMREINKRLNDAIYDAVCGGTPTPGGYALAPKGPHCKTLAGTEEAYYEYMAMVVSEPHPANTGIFTMGGASAQIAIPLTAVDKPKFDALIREVGSTLTCSTLKLGDGSPAPVFAENQSQEQCHKDYVDVKPVAAMPASVKDKVGAGITHVGLISFLNLMGQGGKGLIAGGKNELVTWAKKQCRGPKKSFSACTGELKKYLDGAPSSATPAVKRKYPGDPIWKATKKHFADLSLNNFAFTTDGSQVKTWGGAAAESSTPGTTLKSMVEAACHEAKDGFNGGKPYSCMQAIWASMYITSFFTGRRHPESQIMHKGGGGTYDWVAGLKTGITELLEVPLRHGKHHYMQGVAAELGYN